MDYVLLATELGIRGFIQGKEYRARCPLHNDSNPSWSMNTENGLWICHAGCGAGDFAKLIERVHGCTLDEAYEWLRTFGENRGFRNLQRKFAQTFLFEPNQPDFQPQNMGWRVKYQLLENRVMPLWFMSRGFSWETIWHWDIRYDVANDAVVIPVVWQNELIGTVTRNYRKEFPKYQNSRDLPKSEIIFGEIYRNKSTLILVEGILDALWLWQLGYNAGSIFGSSLSNKQVEIIRQYRFGEIVLALDNDEAGWKGTREAVKSLIKSGWLLPQLKKIQFPNDKKDPQDCSPDLFQELFADRKDILTSDFLTRHESAPRTVAKRETSI